MGACAMRHAAYCRVCLSIIRHNGVAVYDTAASACLSYAIIHKTSVASQGTRLGAPTLVLQASSTSIRFWFVVVRGWGRWRWRPRRVFLPSKAVADADNWVGQVELEGKETHLVALSAQHRRNEVCRRRRPYCTLSSRTCCFSQPEAILELRGLKLSSRRPYAVV